MSTQTEQQPLTDEDIRAIRKRVEMATPEPWRVCTWDPMAHPHVHKDYLDQRTCSGQYNIPLTKEDAIFVAHAREDVPRLLDEIERLRAELDRGRWIPVTERLPEADDKGYGYSDVVLAFDGNVECAYYHPESGTWATANENMLCVTHWQPLPPLPVQESQEA